MSTLISGFFVENIDILDNNNRFFEINYLKELYHVKARSYFNLTSN